MCANYKNPHVAACTRLGVHTSPAPASAKLAALAQWDAMLLGSEAQWQTAGAYESVPLPWLPRI